MNNTKKNIVFQTVYQILNTCLPLITAPYLSRVLGASQLGIFSYTSSIVAYFTLFAMLGTVNYGTKSIAKVKDNRTSRSKVFWEIYLLQFFVTLFLIILYTVYLLFICKENTVIATIQFVLIFSCLFDINWLYFGLEKFKITVSRNVIIRLITLILVLILVKNNNDLWKYTIIMSAGTLFSQLVLWIYLRDNVDFVRIKIKDIIKHFKPNFVLFIPLLAMSVYHIMDKTMLGILSSFEQSGFYYNADKIVNIPVGILSGISTVLLPRITNLISNNKNKEANILFLKSIEFVSIISIAISLGIASISKDFVPIFFGNNYDECISIIIIMSPVLIIKGISITIRNQFLIPNNLEKYYIFSVLLGVISNLIFNVIFIPKYGALGAAIGTILAELSACVSQIRTTSKYIKLKDIFVKIATYLSIGIIMFLFVMQIGNLNLNVYVKIVIEILVGAFLYITLCIMFWKKTNHYLYYKFIKELKKKNGGYI